MCKYIEGADFFPHPQLFARCMQLKTPSDCVALADPILGAQPVHLRLGRPARLARGHFHTPGSLIRHLILLCDTHDTVRLFGSKTKSYA